MKYKDKNNNIPKKDQHQVCDRKVKYITRATHTACGKKNVSMVPGTFMNALRSGSEFVNEDSY